MTDHKAFRAQELPNHPQKSLSMRNRKEYCLSKIVIHKSNLLRTEIMFITVNTLYLRYKALRTVLCSSSDVVESALVLWEEYPLANKCGHYYAYTEYWTERLVLSGWKMTFGNPSTFQRASPLSLTWDTFLPLFWNPRWLLLAYSLRSTHSCGRRNYTKVLERLLFLIFLGPDSWDTQKGTMAYVCFTDTVSKAKRYCSSYCFRMGPWGQRESTR